MRVEDTCAVVMRVCVMVRVVLLKMAYVHDRLAESVQSSTMSMKSSSLAWTGCRWVIPCVYMLGCMM